ncbi:MAG: hypothetical protein WD738_08560 [Pirellulales bacterium]
MRELLIRYLLGELGDDEQQELERRLAANPTLRRELAHLQSCFAAACDSQELPADAPRGLAERTSERVASDCDDQPLVDYLSDRAAKVAAASDPPAGVLGWSLADLTVAGGVVLAVSMLLFPALGDSRNATRRTVCQDNQRQLWFVLANFAEDRGGYYPKIEPTENAGSFAVQLVERGYIRAEDLAVLLVCPGAPLADAIRSRQFVMRIPSLSQLRSMSPRQLAQARRNMSPFYAYCFPYRVGDKYHHIRDQRLPLSPVFSDTAGAEQEGFMSPNHGGSIVQVTSQDGSVRSLRSSTMPGYNDELFVNSLGLVAAGLSRQDAVLGRSEATPALDTSAARR